jgi:hypothetical protein
MKFESNTANTIEKKIPKSEKEELFEQIFNNIVNNRILEDFQEDIETALDELDLDTDNIEDAQEALNFFNPEEQKQVLSLPASIRISRFKNILPKIRDKNGKIDFVVFFNSLLAESKKLGSTLGYHISPKNINRQEGQDWCIQASDFDDRDNQKMAYYSMDYLNLYRKKQGNFLYVVRAETGQGSSHRQDNDGKWGRASRLSIISCIPLDDLDREVNQNYEQRYKKAA